MPCACIDIGSNTTRLLVAERAPGGMTSLAQERAFTRLGRGSAPDGTISPAKIREVAVVVGAQARRARELGAVTLRAVATAAIRHAPNGEELAAAAGQAAGVEVEVLTGDEEARLAFLGATAAEAAPLTGDVAVLDVGGGSSELAVGTVDAGVRWSVSVRLGSGQLTDTHLRGDPPGAAELDAAREHVESLLGGLHPGTPALALAVGGSATSLHRLAGPTLEPAALEEALRVLCSAPAEPLAARLGLAPERVRLLPAGIVILTALAERLGCPLRVGRGGLREGVILELLSTGGEEGDGQGA